MKTLGQLRATLQNRLGFGAAGASAGVNAPIIDSFLIGAQAQLYWEVDWNILRKRADITIGASQTLVDYPSDANTERVQKIAVLYSGRWSELRHGIDVEHYDSSSTQGPPERYEFLGSQIEVWPKTNAVYTLKFFYVKKLGPFSIDSDQTSIDDEIVFLHALANAKAHYEHPDAQSYAGQVNNLLQQLKAHNSGTRSHSRKINFPDMDAPYKYPPTGTVL